MRLALVLAALAALLVACRSGGGAPGAEPTAAPPSAAPVPTAARTAEPGPRPSLAACLAGDGSSPGVEAELAAAIAAAAARRFPHGGVLSAWGVVPGSVSARHLGGALYEYAAEYEVAHAHPGEAPLLTERLSVAALVDASSCAAEVTLPRP